MFLSVPIVQCIEVYTEKKHEYDIVDITYSCGKTGEQTQLTLKELWDSSVCLYPSFAFPEASLKHSVSDSHI